MRRSSQFSDFVQNKNVRIPWRGRLSVTYLFFSLCFIIITIRLIDLGLSGKPEILTGQSQIISTVISRPDIVDRNGHLLATDIRTASVHANPSKIVDVDEAIEKLIELFSDIDENDLRKKLSNRKKKFAWIKRGSYTKTGSRCT